jgi:hypothetical protein
MKGSILQIQPELDRVFYTYSDNPTHCRWGVLMAEMIKLIQEALLKIIIIIRR